MATIQIRLIEPSEIRTALRLSLATTSLSSASLERQVTAFMEYARAMSFDLSLQWVCESGGRPVAACTCILSPGRTAMLMLPSAGRADIDRRTLGRLIAHAAEEMASRGVRLFQSLIGVDDAVNREALQREDFCEIAVLLYLERPAARGGAPPEPDTPDSMVSRACRWMTYTAADHDAFARLIEATYIDGLDCPGLSEWRDIEDVIEGHKHAGRFDARRWSLLICDGRPAGCILFAENPLRPTMELVYMGVHPDFRRQSVGRYILDWGLHNVCMDQTTSVTLAVDARNAPARRLYDQAGFRQTMRRRAMIRPLALKSVGA
jgi:ribosomal protein S18 acetylase RimI-like enzyme